MTVAPVLAASPVGSVLCALVSLYSLAIFVAIVMSWFPISPGGPADSVFRFLRRITDPVLMPLRRVIPPIAGTIDLSPTIVLLVLLIIVRPLVCSL